MWSGLYVVQIRMCEMMAHGCFTPLCHIWATDWPQHRQVSSKWSKNRTGPNMEHFRFESRIYSFPREQNIKQKTPYYSIFGRLFFWKLTLHDSDIHTVMFLMIYWSPDVIVFHWSCCKTSELDRSSFMHRWQQRWLYVFYTVAEYNLLLLCHYYALSTIIIPTLTTSQLCC